MKDKQVSQRIYIIILFGMILYGLGINFIMTKYSINILNIIPNIWLFYIAYFALAIVGIFISNKSSRPLFSFLGYNMVVVPIGWVAETTIKSYSDINPTIVNKAIFITFIIFVIMTISAFIFPDAIRKLGKFLFIALSSLVMANILSLIFHFKIPHESWISAIIFTLYIAYDIRDAFDKEYTIDNAIDCAISIYLDIINLFLDILKSLGNNDD